ncbi:hypothetical protein ACHAXT_000863 [Thalassiosira profunda]
MKLRLLLALAGCAFAPAYGFVPSARRAAASLPSNPAPSIGHQPAITLAPPTRLLFTPKEDGDAADADKPFIRPALHNSTFFRSLAILYALLFAIYQGSAAPSTALEKGGRFLVLSPKAAATVHLLSFATWFGTVVYTTFVAGITMFKNLPRRTFGSIQSKLFPLYFRLCSAMIGVQILTLTRLPDILGKASEVSLAIAFVTTLLNLLYLEPQSTRVMFDRYALEDDGKRDSDEYKGKAKAFGKLHGMSSLANLAALCGGVVHGVRLASGLTGLSA